MLNLIVAPHSLNKKAEKCAKRVVKILKNEKIEFSVYFSANIDDISTSTHELITAGETEFVLVGDDKLFQTFINTVKDPSKKKIGLIPTGKYNNFANYIGIAKKPAQAIKDILERNIETMDYLVLNNTTKILNNITIGATAELFELYAQYKMKNIFSKKYLLSKYGNKFEGIELSFITPKTTRPKLENIFELSISNSGLLNGYNISPLSNVQDGLLNVNYTLLPAKEDRKKYLKMLKTGKQTQISQTTQLWQDSVRLTNPERRIKILADGNLKTVEEINVQVVENGLKIYKKID